MLLMRYLIYALVCLLIGCSEQQESDVPVVAFDLSSAKQMEMSEFVDSITLIPLETNDSSLIQHIGEFKVAGTSLFIKDGNILFSFDDKGNFLYSTRPLQGRGPEEYYSAVSFALLPVGGLEVFDVVRSKVVTYDRNLRYVSQDDLPQEILPASGCLYLSEDYRLFLDKGLLKLYAVREKKVVATCKGWDIRHFGYFRSNGFQCKDGAFYVSTRNDNVYYELFFAPSELRLIPKYRFDFGAAANFDLSKLPEGETEQYYMKYTRNNPHYAFVDSKYVDGGKSMCFFTYKEKSYFAYQDEARGLNQVYYNIPMTKRQFLPAHFYQNRTFYYVCEPQYLDDVVDKSLMSSEELDKMDSVLEDDNPIIVCYKLKE